MVASKVHILGGAGSGKTTLAGWLSETLQIPCIHLDQVGWNEGGKVPLDTRMVEIEKILGQPARITEGAFLWWTDPLFDHAETIVYLDLPFPINAWRMVKRHMNASLKGNNPHGGIRNLVDFIYGVGRRYYMKQPLVPKGPDDDFAITRAAMIETLSGYAEKVVRCRSPREVRAFQERIRAQVGARSSTKT